MNIVETKLSTCTITTLKPSGWLTRAFAVKQGTTSIKEAIYVPSPILFDIFDDAKNAREDEHICSQLVDQGITVHALTDLCTYSSSEYCDALCEVLELRMKSVPLRSVALIATELSSVTALNFLAHRALPMTPCRMDIGALVLIDPPPLTALYSPEGKINMLTKRYSSLFNTVESFSAQVGIDIESLVEEKRNVAHKRFREYSHFLYRRPTIRRILKMINDRQDGTRISIDSSSFESTDLQYKMDLRIMIDEIAMQDEDNFFNLKLALKEQLVKNFNIPSAPNPFCRDKSARNLSIHDLIGAPVTSASLVGQALKNRILVINSGRGFKIESAIDYEIPSYTADDWGDLAIEELANMYKASPVIYLCEEVDEEIDIDDDEAFDVDTRQGENINDPDAASDDYFLLAKSHRTHRKLSKIVSDWFFMLPKFS